MSKINLRDLYPEYELDCFVEVVDGEEEYFAAAMTKTTADAYYEFQREEHAYYERRRYHRAFYSLNAGDGIGNNAVHHSQSPEELFMDRLTRQQLFAALALLPQSQRRRVEAHFILGMSKTEIAKAEGVDESTVREGIERGLRSLKKYLKNIL